MAEYAYPFDLPLYSDPIPVPEHSPTVAYDFQYPSSGAPPGAVTPAPLETYTHVFSAKKNKRKTSPNKGNNGGAFRSVETGDKRQKQEVDGTVIVISDEESGNEGELREELHSNGVMQPITWGYEPPLQYAANFSFGPSPEPSQLSQLQEFGAAFVPPMDHHPGLPVRTRECSYMAAGPPPTYMVHQPRAWDNGHMEFQPPLSPAVYSASGWENAHSGLGQPPALHRGYNPLEPADFARSQGWESPYSGPQPPPGLPSAYPKVQAPLDHMGVPLSAAAIAIAREYWASQREYDFCPIDAIHIEGPCPEVHPLLRMARHRRTYTKLVLGVGELEPGQQTFEPPWIDMSPITCGEPPPIGGVQPSPAPQPGMVQMPEEANQAAETGPRTEPVLCPEQAALVELAASGRNIFYTGSAGCGKSTVLHAIRKRLQDEGLVVKVMAPTGKVALAIKGTTTWTFAGWTPDHHKRPLNTLKKAAKSRTISERFKGTDVIIIDEISMVENLHFERLNEAMKAGRGSKSPFGGCQVIVTGDFCQLPPVKPFQHCITCGNTLLPNTEETIYNCNKCGAYYAGKDKWAFRSKAWQECDFVHVHLKSIHRQNDQKFISLLQKCRLGIPFTSDEVQLLVSHHSVTANAVKLFSTREEVRRTNEEAFARLKTPPHSFKCLDDFRWNENLHPLLAGKGDRNPDGSLRALNDHRYDRRLELKVGMLVVLLTNLDLPSGLCNGSQGIIAGFEPYDPKKLPRQGGNNDQRYDSNGAAILRGEHATLKEGYIKQFAESQRPPRLWPIVRFLNKQTRTIYADCQVHELGDVSPYSLLCRTQIPLAPAWALSIHKSQGMTLDRVVVNLSRAFEEGQVYVALSRATSLEGLKVEGNPDGLAVGKGGNEQVREFLREKFGM